MATTENPPMDPSTEPKKTAPVLSFTIKVSGQPNVTIECDKCEKVSDLKKLIEEKTKMAPTHQKLVFKGKVLVDDDLLTDKKVITGSTIFLAKGVASSSSSSSTVVEKKETVEAVRQKCVGGCGFWGDPKMENYCSKCFKEKQVKDQEKIKKEQDEAIRKEKEAEEAKNPKKPEEEKKERPVQENKMKCWTCNKKVGLTGIECRCGYVFCGTHRMPEDHQCDFDYKTAGQDLLRKQNNKVEADKLGDRV